MKKLVSISFLSMLVFAFVSSFTLFTAPTNTISAQRDDDFSFEFDSTSDDEEAGAIGLIFSLLIICCVVIFSFAVPFGFAVWVYKDANKYEVENAFLWALLTFFFTLIGVLVYFLAIRPDYKKKFEEGEGSVIKETKAEDVKVVEKK